MEPDYRQIGNHRASPGRGLLPAAFAIVTGSALLALGFIFSLVILTVAAVAGLLGYGYLWWKTRALRQQLKERMQQTQGPKTDSGHQEGIIIEGEVLREERK